MKRSYILQNLDCATCAALMEQSIAQMPEIKAVSISFMTCRMVLEADDITAGLLREVRRRIEKVNPDTYF